MSARRNVRGVLLSLTGRVLLMQIKEPSSGREEWITPGGKIDQEEDVVTGLYRELMEETGGEGFQVGPLIWTRNNTSDRYSYLS